MVAAHKKHLTELWQGRTKPPKRDPEAEQLRRDRITALIIVGIMALFFAVIAILSAFTGGPTGNEMFDPWIMP
jgi:hypothetical protein